MDSSTLEGLSQSDGEYGVFPFMISLSVSSCSRKKFLRETGCHNEKAVLCLFLIPVSKIDSTEHR